MKDRLLICIASYYTHERLKYLFQLLDCFIKEYKTTLDIFIDTNSEELRHLLASYRVFSVNVFVHDLSHPFHLTWKHRKHMKENINNYSHFMYIEDDILLPYDNYKNYLEIFRLLWPSFIPSFVRIETANDQEYITDATQRQKLDIFKMGGKQFAELKNPYHGFWIMPAKELKETMISDFDRVSDSREHAAAYPLWELHKIGLVEIENNLISKKCYSYHLPNTYAISNDTPFAKIKPENIFT